MKKNFKILALAAVMVASLSACGGNNEKKETTTTDTTTKVEETAPASATTGTTLEIEANDQMKFDKTELKAVAGQEITLTIKNVGKFEKKVMGHNIVFLKAGTDVEAYATKAMAAADADYIPASESGSVIAHSKLLGPGESDTITFTVPEKGTYDFICSFPGHHSLMKGKLIVE